MPAAFAYLAALFAYVGVAFLLLVSALLLALIPRFRSVAKRLALGVPGSFVGVFAFQLAALPIVFATLWTLAAPVAYFHGGGQTTSPLVAVSIIGALLIAATFFALASLAGFVTGWGAAIALGEGIRLRAFLASNRVWQLVSTIFRRPYRLPLLLWLLSAWSAFGISGVRCWLNSGATAAEVPGTYRAGLSLQERLLDIRADGSWEYRLESQSEPLRAGKWTFEPRMSDSTTVVITFKVETGFHQNQIVIGSPLERSTLARPGFVYSDVARDCAGKLRVCFGADDRICFERMGEIQR